MQYDNYIIAFQHHNVIPLNRWTEYFVRKCCFSENPHYHTTSKLKSKFHRYSIILMLCIIFILPILIINIVGFYFDSIYVDKTFFTSMDYEIDFLWKTRYYNELPHFFKKRIHDSRKHLTQYVECFQNVRYQKYYVVVSFICSVFYGFLLALSFCNDHVLIEVELFGRNILWYLVVLGTILSLVRNHKSFEKHPKSKFQKHLKDWNEIMGFFDFDKHDSYIYEQANSTYFASRVHKIFSPIYVLLAKDILNFIKLPCSLWEIGNNSGPIIEFIQHNTVWDEEICESMCRYGDFVSFDRDWIDEKMSKSIHLFNHNNSEV